MLDFQLEGLISDPLRLFGFALVLIMFDRVDDGLFFGLVAVFIDIHLAADFMRQGARPADAAGQAAHAFDEVEVDIAAFGLH